MFVKYCLVVLRFYIEELKSLIFYRLGDAEGRVMDVGGGRRSTKEGRTWREPYRRHITIKNDTSYQKADNP